MNSYLAAAVDKEDRAKAEEIFKKSDFLLDILAKVCYNIIRESQEVTTNDYSSSSWAYEQAHRNGKVEALQQILLTINRKET